MSGQPNLSIGNQSVFLMLLGYRLEKGDRAMVAAGGETYVVRIYRRAAKDSEQLVGMVEWIDGGKKSPFHTQEQM